MSALRVELPDGVDPRVGELLWQLGDARRRTLETLAKVTDDNVVRQPVTGRNTIGTLLQHEAEHRGHIQTLLTGFGGTDDW